VSETGVLADVTGVRCLPRPTEQRVIDTRPMNHDELTTATTRLKRFLLCSLVPLAVWLLGDELGVPMWLGLGAMLAVLLTPIASLPFSWPVAKALRQSRALLLLVTLLVPIGYLAIGYVLVREGRKSRPADTP
jgi:hypothetical protein